MKLNLTVEDLNSLTFSQKQALNSLWVPAKYDRAVASVCTDAENDVYEYLEFVVGDIIVTPGSTRITLERLKKPEEFVVADEEPLPEEDEELSAGEIEMPEEEFPEIPFETSDYFLKDECLPLLNIGQLIELLRNTRAGHDGFTIEIPPAGGLDSFKGFAISDRYGEVDRNEELIDLLFNVLKEQL